MNIQFKFSDKLTTDEDHLVIALNTLAAIEDAIERGMGITPDSCDHFTKSVTITNGIWDVLFIVGTGTFVRIPETPLWVSTLSYGIYNEGSGDKLAYVADKVPFAGETAIYFEIIKNYGRNV